MQTRLEWNEIKTILDRHAYKLSAPAATPWHGLGLGNADIGAIVFGSPHKLTFRLAKMDLWDARMPQEFIARSNPISLSEMKKRVFEMSANDENFKGLVTLYKKLEKYGKGDTMYPCLRIAGDLQVRVSNFAGDAWPFPIIKFNQQLFMSNGLYEADYEIGTYWPVHRQHLKLQSFISWQHNVLAVKLTLPEPAGNKVGLTIWRDPHGGRDKEWLTSSTFQKYDEIGNYREDPRGDMLPPSRIEANGNQASIRQVIPGDDACPDREYVINATSSSGEFGLTPNNQAGLKIGDKTEITLFIAIASEAEASEPFARAKKLSTDAASRGWDTLYNEHAERWQDFWMKSAVSLDDPSLERLWVRQTQIAAMSQRSKRPPQGLFGVHVPCDCPAWRGDRHNNMPEFSSRFWADFGANHEEQALNYTEFVKSYLPTARKIAKEIFECERGAFYPTVYFDGTSKYLCGSYVSRSLYLPAIHAQNCWWHYQYFQDLDFLKEQAYPVMRECALFYVELLAKNKPGDYTLWPTVPAETTGWTKNFKLNKNCIEDIANVKFLMRAVLEASSILGKDNELRDIWQEILEHLSPYPTVNENGKEEFTDLEGRTERFNYNHAVPFSPMWPAEDPEVVNDPKLLEIARNTMDIDLPAFEMDTTRRFMSCLRIGLKEKVWQELLGKELPDDNGGLHCDGITRHLSFGSAVVVQEMLMTSWNGFIEVFPGWPHEKNAYFQDLRTKGAFLISSSLKDGVIEYVNIRSEKGKSVFLRLPWQEAEITEVNSQNAVVADLQDGILRFTTEAGKCYMLTDKNK